MIQAITSGRAILVQHRQSSCNWVCGDSGDSNFGFSSRTRAWRLRHTTSSEITLRLLKTENIAVAAYL